jgi:hypothetical protein
MAWCSFGSVYLLVHAPGIPRDEDWDEFIKDVTSAVLSGIVVVAGAAKLTPKQRVDVQRWFEKNGVKGSVVTDSAVARGVVTALGWFKVKLRAFSPREIDHAFDYVEIPTDQRAGARAMIERLERALKDQHEPSAAG